MQITERFCGKGTMAVWKRKGGLVASWVSQSPEGQHRRQLQPPRGELEIRCQREKVARDMYLPFK